MATQVVVAATGLPDLATPTLRVFADGSDTQVSGSPFTLVEATNRKGYYSVSFTGTLDGLHLAHLYSGSDFRGVGWVDLENADGTYYVRSERVDAESAIEALAGTGARSVAITVDDGTDPLEGARVRLAKGAESYVQTTNASGVVTYSLNDGTWDVTISLEGYSFTPTTLVVNGTETVTYSMGLETIPASSVDLTTGYLYTYSAAGATQSGVDVLVAAIGPGDSVGIAAAGTARTVTSASGGLVSITNMHKGMQYRITRNDGTSPRGYTHTIPTTAGDTYELPSIIGGT